MLSTAFLGKHLAQQEKNMQSNQERFQIQINRINQINIDNYIYPNGVDFHRFAPVECHLCFHCSRSEDYFLHSEPFASEITKLVLAKRSSSKRLEIYKKYQHSAGIKALCTILHFHDSVSDEVSMKAVEMLINLTNQAMREAGCELGESAQQVFDNCIYFDFTMPVVDKIKLLQLHDGELAESTKQMIKELSECLK